MRLLSLPFLIRKAVMDEMSLNNIFFLSLCSKNMKNVIKHTQKFEFEKDEFQFVRCLIPVNGVISISVGIRSYRCCNDFMHLFKTPIDFIESRCKEGGAVEEVQVNELGTSTFRCPMNQSNLHAKFTADNGESIIETIHNHLCDLLGRHPEVEILTCFRTNRFLPLLRNTRILAIQEGDESASTKLNDFLLRSDCLEAFDWWGADRNDMKFEEDSKVYQLDTLDVFQSRYLATDVLKYFNGRCAFLHCDSITTPDIIQFLNAWRSGEKFRNLEVICMEISPDIEGIRGSIDVKELNTIVKYSFSCKNPFEERNKFESRLYMVRESDGHVASVLLEDERVYMGVWNMTENKFLEKFQ